MAENRCLEKNEDGCIVEINDTSWFYPERLRKLMDFTGTSCSALAKKSGVPEGTLRKLLQGETKDPRASTFVPPLKVLGADANIVLGLSPARDYDGELAQEGKMLADVLRKQIEEMQKKAAEDDRRMVRLREMLLEASKAQAAAEGRVESLEYMVSKRDETIHNQTETIAQMECRLETKRSRIESLTAESSTYAANCEGTKTELAAVRKSRDKKSKICRRLIWALCISVIALVALSTYTIWEINNIDQGQTAARLEAYLAEYEASLQQ